MNTFLRRLTRCAFYTLFIYSYINSMDLTQEKSPRTLYTAGIKNLLERNETCAISLLKQASEKNYPPALNLLGWCYQNSHYEKNPTLAVGCYEKAAKMRYIPAIINLAYCYTHGIGVEKEFKKARDLYQAIQEYSPGAKLNLGSLYIEGLIIKENCLSNNRATIKKESVDFGFSLFEALATTNYPKALLAVARCYELGRGTPQNWAVSTFWYQKYIKGKDTSEKCSICLEELINEQTTLSSCARGHIFHMPCLYTWLEKNPSCPLCRRLLTN